MTQAEATKCLAKLNRYLAILSDIEARPNPKTAGELEVVKAVREGARQALEELQAFKDMRALIERVAP